VWPAFGHLGGSPELIITEGTAIISGNNPCDKSLNISSIPSKPFDCSLNGHRKLSSPYIDDLYYQVDDVHYPFAVLQMLTHRAIVAIRRKEFSLPNTDNEINEGQFIGYTRSSDGVSLTFGVVGQNTHYSLSIGKRCHNHMVEFMVWGYAWQDWGNFRLYQGPMTSSFIWPLRLISHKFGKCTKEERELLETIFAEELCNNELLKNEVNQTLDLVLDKLKEVDDKALKSFYLIYKLPSNSSFYWP
jgi:hypothetical protein